MPAVNDEELLLALLNSAPIEAGRMTDQLASDVGSDLALRLGGTGSDAEAARLRATRSALHVIVRGSVGVREATRELSAILDATVLEPRVTNRGVDWEIQAPADDRLAARVVLAWSSVEKQFPGRLRPCANSECNLFLLDHSRPGTAKWCSMAACGNRMKARSYASRARG